MSPTTELIVTDPRTGEPVSRVPIADASTCAEAVKRARAAASGWARTPAAERAAALTAAAAAVREAADELAELNERETGKLRDDALGGVDAGAGTLVQYAELGPLHRGRSLHGQWTATDLMVPEPRGIVAVLTPWNDPVAVAAGLLGAALVTGNAVVHKPSERSPRTGRRFAELLAEQLPDGVLEIVDGDGSVGASLASADDVDVVAHVGSSATGRAIARTCAERGAKVILENGGNDALIVDTGVSPRWAAEQAAMGAFANAGQICVSVERIYVVDAIADAFVDALVDEARAWAQRIGPLVDERQRDVVHEHVADAARAGARIRIGGEPAPGPGSFYPPTVLTDCTPDMLVMREETFGPVAPVRVVPNFDTALMEAAADRYGLAATVLTNDMARAQTAWRSLPVGTVKINAAFGGAPGGASEPRRASGSGFGFGPELLDEMTAMKVVHWSPAPHE
ncbi:aldehyde dehydrogenase family protein [Mycolicibacterium litorale]|uniref:Aldehyde dehydrogenase n=1 Tax=Mycolicibacterium litorale TaxID=758802 RepID=A0AAD1MSR6_9MYCO|nr:aldehyde dehydrogenase family protein [Mycolicibacterium litorale]TDY08142.1 acyl-CoA reductase-like NAD-dependent aldehyde dehydrogenase [Mycolicibacterium litorale]BBY16065.1 aldehyde dehydrogenase [Mycolicibacterium litorale]